MDLTFGALLVAVAATFVGATIQGSLGFGMNLITVPALALVLPEALPVAVILLALPMSIGMVAHERRAVDRAGAAWILLGRLPGTIAGAAVVAAVSTRALQAVTGIVVLLLVLASLRMPPVVIRPPTQIVAGVVSGITGTAAGIGGPPLALLYQHRDGPTMRSTLALTFFVGMVMSLATLGIAGQVNAGPMLLGAGLGPIVMGGVILGRRFHDHLDAGWLRPAVLAFAGLSAVSVLINAAL